ncbi:MAG: hypothetical protein WEA58_14450 [Balneolaceae bacterium]
MKQLSQEEAQKEISKYQESIIESFDQAVSTANELADPCFTKRTRACMIRDLAVKNLKAVFKSVDNVRVLEKDNTVLFRIGESIIGRVKKLDKKFNASYNLTPSSEKFTNQQVELFGDEYRLTSVHIGYVLDDFGVGIKNIIITCPVNSGKGHKWLLPLVKGVTENVTIDINEPEKTNEEQDERFKIRPEKQKDKSKNDRTGTGSQGTNTN